MNLLFVFSMLLLFSKKKKTFRIISKINLVKKVLIVVLKILKYIKITWIGNVETKKYQGKLVF